MLRVVYLFVILLAADGNCWGKNQAIWRCFSSIWQLAGGAVAGGIVWPAGAGNAGGGGAARPVFCQGDKQRAGGGGWSVYHTI